MFVRRIDLRSDTVTKPTPEMRKAMAEAEVGDDLYRDDPTVTRLEGLYAEMVGKEAALFMPSGTMANQVAIRTHCLPGSYIAAGKTQHIVAYEYGGASRNSGVAVSSLDDEWGQIDVREYQRLLETHSYYGTAISMLALENTHMASGGRILASKTVSELRRASGSPISLHLDGARLFNAQVATGISAQELCKDVDSVMSCVSKGLSAPVGSLLAGSKEFIERARSERAVLGGQMRQVGVIAAAGIVALETMVDRLIFDHERAIALWQAVKTRFGEVVAGHAPQTNIVAFTTPEAEPLSKYLASVGILANPIMPHRMRLVTHRDFSDDDMEYVVQMICDFL